MDTPERREILVILAVVMGLIAVAAGKRVLLLWSFALGALAGGAMLWARVAWRGVHSRARFWPPRVFAGEPVWLLVTLRNAKRLPLPLVRVSVWLPAGLRPAQGEDASSIRGFQRRLWLPGRSEVTMRLGITARRRGEFRLERLRVELSDPFDLSPLYRELTPETTLLVMPEARIQVPVEVRRRLPFGRPAAAARIFEERERFAGVRPYEPGDPLNRIHWKLTGHSGALQVKLFEPTRSAHLLLALDLAVGEPFWDSIYPDIAEDTIGWASFLARDAFEAGWRVGLVANTHLTRGRGPLRVPSSTARGHEAALFAAMARMPNEATSDLAPVLREMGRRLPRDTVAVVISPRPGSWLKQEMEVLTRRGMDIVQVSPLEAA